MEAQKRRGFDPDAATAEDRARPASPFFGDLLHTQVCAFNPKYKEAEGALVGELQRLKADIYGNREFLKHLRNQGKFFSAEDNRELDLILIDYGDTARLRDRWTNAYEVTEEFYVHNGRYGTREDVVFIINGIPVLVVECKNASKDEAIALGVDQIRRYHTETPEVMVPEMIFTATEAIGFAYGATWSLMRRNIFNWKHDEVGNLEAKVKSFCAVPHVLRLLKDFILFAERDEELQKVILRQHQTAAVEKVVARALDPKLARGLVWHTQGSGKTYTMIKAAELLFKANEAQKPTVLLMIDRNELEIVVAKLPSLRTSQLCGIRPEFGLFQRFLAEAVGKQSLEKCFFQFDGQRQQALLLLHGPLHQPQHRRYLSLLGNRRCDNGQFTEDISVEGRHGNARAETPEV